MNLYVWNGGLYAPPNGDPTVYESFRFEAHQLFGSPNEILGEVLSYDPTVICNSFLAINDSNISSETYQSTDMIISEGTVSAGNNVTFEAQNSVLLTPGFHAQGTSNFIAKIGGCEVDNVQAENHPVNTFRLASPNTEEDDDFSVFPNPTRDQIEIVSHAAAPFNIQIFDVRGVEVLSRKYTNPTNIIDLQHFSKGMYFVSFRNLTTGQQAYKTIVKQ